VTGGGDGDEDVVEDMEAKEVRVQCATLDHLEDVSEDVQKCH
jgi:hypothetical protein